MKITQFLCMAVLCMLVAQLSFAQVHKALASHSLPVSPEETIRQRLAASFPLREIRSIIRVADGGLYQVEFMSGLLLYALPSGQYLLTGNLYKTVEGGYVNLSEQKRQVVRAERLVRLQPNEYLTLAAVEQPPKAVVYVYVDIDCYYCRLQHGEAVALTAAGIELRYLALNRQKPGSMAYHKVRHTWCAEEPQQALDLLMQGRSVTAKQCTEGLMDKHARLAEALGVKRLPTMVTADGRLVSGLLRASQVLALLGIEVVEPIEDTTVNRVGRATMDQLETQPSASITD
ncbi:MAG: DsbC family protein [Pseudomonadales bacterium]